MNQDFARTLKSLSDSLRVTVHHYGRLCLLLLGLSVAAFSLARLTLTSSAQGQATVATVSAASYASVVAPDSIAAAFGTGLATATQGASVLPLPKTLAGTTVKVNGREAGLFFVSPNQINYLIPPETEPRTAQVEVRGDAKISTGTVQVSATAPAMFTMNATGTGPPAANVLRVTADSHQFYESPDQPISLGPAGEKVFLILYLTGIRRAAPDTVQVLMGDTVALVSYAGAAPGFVGLDQINAEIPRSLIGRGEVDVRVTAPGAPVSNKAKVTIAGASNQAATSVTLTASASPSGVSQSVTFTAKVAVNPPAINAPTGRCNSKPMAATSAHL